jgi:tRNA (guanine-N7-)-methyltransferase
MGLKLLFSSCVLPAATSILARPNRAVRYLHSFPKLSSSFPLLRCQCVFRSLNTIVGEEIDSLSKPAFTLKSKIRNHVNPLASSYQVPISLPDNWMAENYESLDKKFILDIGCAKGAWAVGMCSHDSSINILGLEIRRPMVDWCIAGKQRAGLKNVHFLAANANVDLNYILDSVKANGVKVSTVTIQFPDPQFKVRHQKRRVVNETFVESLAQQMEPGSMFFMQTDIETLAHEIVDFFVHSKMFTPAPGYDVVKLENNKSPFPVQSDREKIMVAKGDPVYRMVLHRNNVGAQKRS